MRGVLNSESGSNWTDQTKKWSNSLVMWKALTEIIARSMNTVQSTIKGVKTAVATIKGIKS